MRIRIGVQVGATIQVKNGPMGDYDFLKPSAWAEMELSNEDLLNYEEAGILDETIKEKWNYLWEDQVAPQAEQLIDMMMKEASRRGVTRDKDMSSPKQPVKAETAKPVEGVYD